jgi:hypothetical protein
MRTQNPAQGGIAGLGKAANSSDYPNTWLPLVVSLKRALVFSGAEGHISREHARPLLALLDLRGV